MREVRAQKKHEGGQPREPAGETCRGHVPLLSVGRSGELQAGCRAAAAAGPMRGLGLALPAHSSPRGHGCGAAGPLVAAGKWGPVHTLACPIRHERAPSPARRIGPARPAVTRRDVLPYTSARRLVRGWPTFTSVLACRAVRRTPHPGGIFMNRGSFAALAALLLAATPAIAQHEHEMASQATAPPPLYTDLGPRTNKS